MASRGPLRRLGAGCQVWQWSYRGVCGVFDGLSLGLSKLVRRVLRTPATAP